MHYRIGRGIVVRTENAAKPEKQQSSYLVSFLRKLKPVSSSFDYGCGKLRYTAAILKTTETLAIVDSEIQLSRQQILRGVTTSVRNLMGHSNQVAVYNDVEFANLASGFDRGFCINVLSVIPILARRRRLLEVIRSHLRPGAGCLFVVQYRNSDFDRMRKMRNTKPWRDGFLIDSLRGFSFYGIISPQRLASAVERAGFKVDDVRLNDGSVYLWASR
jgi:SAM-dependent methyltransferase